MTLAISRRADSNRFPIESSMEEFISGGLQLVEGIEEAVLVGAEWDRFSGQQADEPAAVDGPAAVGLGDDLLDGRAGRQGEGALQLAGKCFANHPEGGGV